MLLQETGRDDVEISLDRSGTIGPCLRQTRAGQDLTGVENRADAHRDRPSGHVLLAEEVAGRVATRDAVERDQPRAAVAAGTRLVETDVSGATDAQQLDVDATRRWDCLLVSPAVVVDLGFRRSCRRECECWPGQCRRWSNRCSRMNRT